MHSLKDFEDILTENADLGRLTSFRTGGAARWLFEPSDEGRLAGLFAYLTESGTPWRILGGGTNILVSEKGYGGAVIRLAGELAGLGFRGAVVTAGGGAGLARLVGECSRRGLSGAQCLAGIPGTVGGALVMNAGGRWGEIGGLVRSVRVMDNDGVRDLAREECGFAYRESALGGRVVLSAVLELSESDAEAVRARTEQLLRLKALTQELSAHSAGCVFKNPASGPTAGELIEKAGLKGFRIGGAEVSGMHANYIINTGSARSSEIMEVIEAVRSGVKAECGVELELEIELW